MKTKQSAWPLQPGSSDLRATDVIRLKAHLLTDKDESKRKRMVELIGELGDVAAVDPLTKALRVDSSTRVRAW